MTNKLYLFLNLVFSPVLAMLTYSMVVPVVVGANPDSAFFNVILPVAFSSIIISGLFIVGLLLFKKSIIWKQIITITIISLVISSVLSPVTLGFVTMSSYLIYCNFGTC